MIRWLRVEQDDQEISSQCMISFSESTLNFFWKATDNERWDFIGWTLTPLFSLPASLNKVIANEPAERRREAGEAAAL